MQLHLSHYHEAGLAWMEGSCQQYLRGIIRLTVMRLRTYYMLEKRSVLYLSYMTLKQFYAAGMLSPISERMKLKLKEAK